MFVTLLTHFDSFFFGPERLRTVKAIRLRSMKYRTFLELYEALVVFAFLSVTIPRLKLRRVSTSLLSLHMTSSRKYIYKVHIFFFGPALLTKYTDDQIENNLMGRARRTHREEVGCIQGFGEETRGKENTWKTQE